MEELKVCPHCGGKATFERFDNPKNWFVVRCTVCGCQTDGWRWNKATATAAENKTANAAAWNRRAAPENKALTLEELLKAIRNIPYGLPEFRDSNGCTDSLVVNLYKAILKEAVKEAFAYAREAEGSEKP